MHRPPGPRRIAFFGGSFDPPHLGHLAIARAARDRLELDQLLFAPVGAQPLKPQGASASFADRVAMTQLAIRGEAAFAVSLADAPNDSGQPNYTLATLQTLRNECPPGARLFLLMGADSFLTLRQWRGAADIPFAAELIVASRPGQPFHDPALYLPAGVTAVRDQAHDREGPAAVHSFALRDLAGRETRLWVLPDLDVEISASSTRAQAQAQDGLARLVPEDVAVYIREHGLYR